MCFVDSNKVFNQVLGKVMVWVMRKKGIYVASVGAVMSPYNGRKSEIWIPNCLKKYKLKFEYIIHVCYSHCYLAL